ACRRIGKPIEFLLLHAFVDRKGHKGIGGGIEIHNTTVGAHPNPSTRVGKGSVDRIAGQAIADGEVPGLHFAVERAKVDPPKPRVERTDVKVRSDLTDGENEQKPCLCTAWQSGE